MDQNPHIKTLWLPLSDLPQLNGEIFCSPVCGYGCTRADFDKAHKTGLELEEELGKGWTYTVWENDGWYVKIISEDKRLIVYPPCNHRYLFSASLGHSHGHGALARYLADGATAHDALEAVCGVARTTAHDALAMVAGLEY